MAAAAHQPESHPALLRAECLFNLTMTGILALARGSAPIHARGSIAERLDTLAVFILVLAR